MSGVGAPAMRPRGAPGGAGPRSPPYVWGWGPSCPAPPTRLEATTPWATPYMSGVGPPAMRPRKDPPYMSGVGPPAIRPRPVPRPRKRPPGHGPGHMCGVGAPPTRPRPVARARKPPPGPGAHQHLTNHRPRSVLASLTSEIAPFCTHNVVRAPMSPRGSTTIALRMAISRACPLAPRGKTQNVDASSPYRLLRLVTMGTLWSGMQGVRALHLLCGTPFGFWQTSLGRLSIADSTNQATTYLSTPLAPRHPRSFFTGVWGCMGRRRLPGPVRLTCRAGPSLITVKSGSGAFSEAAPQIAPEPRYGTHSGRPPFRASQCEGACAVWGHRLPPGGGGGSMRLEATKRCPRGIAELLSEAAPQIARRRLHSQV
eukprot:gene17721-biopygen9892